MTHHLLQIGGITPDMRERLEAAFTIHQLDDFDQTAITHVITNGHDGVNPELMTSLSNLKVISGYGVGYDAIDVTEAVRRNILVAHTPNVLNQEVATTALLLLLACYRELLRDDAYVRSGDWQSQGQRPAHPLDGQTDRWNFGAWPHWSGHCRQARALGCNGCLPLSHEKRCALSLL